MHYEKFTEIFQVLSLVSINIVIFYYSFFLFAVKVCFPTKKLTLKNIYVVELLHFGVKSDFNVNVSRGKSASTNFQSVTRLACC